jgi:hypothetical protein
VKDVIGSILPLAIAVTISPVPINVVEILDTLASQPPGYSFLRDWHYYHGGVANAPAYQLEISAFGYNSGTRPSSASIPGTGSG